MRERPIWFSGPMVRALLTGTKTQTRRVVKPRDIAWMDEHQGLREQCNASRCPYGQPGDRLWVREAWTTHKFMDAIPPRDLQTISIAYVADGKIQTGKYRQAFHMPRRYSRITLEVTGVRVERLQDISEADAIAEGIEPDVEPGDAAPLWRNYATCNTTISPIYSYQTLWEQINGPGSWDANPWVWVVEFKRLEAPDATL